ncbi:unnamed protein product [Amoebophrya sp. A120]|nr:unnamed protein product [Amoebophrya sp. A120]|eukprot:GSA120T00002672001.1
MAMRRAPPPKVQIQTSEGAPDLVVACTNLGGDISHILSLQFADESAPPEKIAVAALKTLATYLYNDDLPSPLTLLYLVNDHDADAVPTEELDRISLQEMREQRCLSGCSGDEVAQLFEKNEKAVGNVPTEPVEVRNIEAVYKIGEDDVTAFLGPKSPFVLCPIISSASGADEEAPEDEPVPEPSDAAGAQKENITDEAARGNAFLYLEMLLALKPCFSFETLGKKRTYKVDIQWNNATFIDIVEPMGDSQPKQPLCVVFKGYSYPLTGKNLRAVEDDKQFKIEARVKDLNEIYLEAYTKQRASEWQIRAGDAESDRVQVWTSEKFTLQFSEDGTSVSGSFQRTAEGPLPLEGTLEAIEEL